jgi:prepilin-type N-terminal cleavage/methylation domain-containing protein
MHKKYGYTLVELIIVIAILAIMIIMSVMILNPVSILGRGHDTIRKKDLKTIKTSFEEYFSDKGNYPTNLVIPGQINVGTLMDPLNCGTTVFSPWLKTWPCDPVTKKPYIISVQNDSTLPTWFKVFTKLERTDDIDVPIRLKVSSATWHGGNGEVGSSDANFGGSSTNVNWYECKIDSYCLDQLTGCYAYGGFSCGAATDGCPQPGRTQCYMRFGCEERCRVPCCGSGCVQNDCN